MTILAAVVLITLTLSAVCSLFEATLYSTRVATLEAAKAQGRRGRGAEIFLGMKKDIAKPTSAILILNTVANTAGATIAGMLAAQLFGGKVVPLFSMLLTFAILMFSEILPKTYGAVHWRHLWPVIVWPLLAIQRALSPVIWLTEKASSLVTRGHSAPATTEDEILAMIQLGAKAGEVSATELELLTAVFVFDETSVREVMVPRHEILVLDTAWSTEQCLKVIRETKHTRYPLCHSTLDDTVGIVHVKDLLGMPETIDLQAVARPVERLPDTMPIRQVLKSMQKSQRHLSLVVDELGTVIGAVTMENVMERLVGAVQDEFDTESPELVTEKTGSYVAQGQLPLVRLNHDLDLDLAWPGVYTLSGYLAASLGRLPRVGDRLPLGELEAEVLEVRQHRASRIRITAPSEEELARRAENPDAETEDRF